MNPVDKALFEKSIIPGIVGMAIAYLPAITQDDVHHEGVMPLDMGDQFRVEAQLDEICRFGGAGQLGVDDFIAEVSEVGRDGYPSQKIRMSDKRAFPQSGLIDDIRTGPHGLLSRRHRRIQIIPVPGRHETLFLR